MSIKTIGALCIARFFLASASATIPISRPLKAVLCT